MLNWSIYTMSQKVVHQTHGDNSITLSILNGFSKEFVFGVYITMLCHIRNLCLILSLIS